MLTRFVAVAALALALNTAPTPQDSANARGATLTPYQQCVLDAYYGCFPGGNPPDLGNPEVQAAFEACYASAYAACESLKGPDD